MKKLYGIIGYPLGHSFSADYFNRKFAEESISGSEYVKFPIADIAEFPALIRDNHALCGMNVTSPYKELVMPYLDSIDVGAACVGAVNCIKIRDGKTTGYNADVYGFRISLLDFLGDERPAAMILGTGGAAKAVKYVLGELGIDHIEVSRNAGTGKLCYGRVDDSVMAERRLIVNATPLGMSPHLDKAPPIPYDSVGTGHFLFDLIYNPAETLFLEQGRLRGAKTMNGYDMLIGQAERSWEIWNG